MTVCVPPPTPPPVHAPDACVDSVLALGPCLKLQALHLGVVPQPPHGHLCRCSGGKTKKTRGKRSSSIGLTTRYLADQPVPWHSSSEPPHSAIFTSFGHGWGHRPEHKTESCASRTPGRRRKRPTNKHTSTQGKQSTIYHHHHRHPPPQKKNTILSARLRPWAKHSRREVGQTIKNKKKKKLQCLPPPV